MDNVTPTAREQDGFEAEVRRDADALKSRFGRPRWARTPMDR